MKAPVEVDGWERIRIALTENMNLKLLSFAFALVLYSLVHGGQDARRSVVVDLEARFPSESADNVLVESLPQSIRIFVRGSNQTIDNLRAASVSVQLDLTNKQPSHVTFEPKMVRLPEGVNVELEQFDPPGIDLKWEQRILRDVPVQVSVVGTPADGFVVKGPLVPEPKTLKVQGPQSIVSVLQFVRADAFDVRGLTEGTYPRELAVERVNQRLKIEPARVVVMAEITREVAERIFNKLPIAIVGIPKGKSTPGDVDVRLVCPPDIVRSLRPEQIIPQVEVTSKDPSGSVSVPIVVRIDKCDAHTQPKDAVVRWGP